MVRKLNGGNEARAWGRSGTGIIVKSKHPVSRGPQAWGRVLSRPIIAMGTVLHYGGALSSPSSFASGVDLVWVITVVRRWSCFSSRSGAHVCHRRLLCGGLSELV